MRSKLAIYASVVLGLIAQSRADFTADVTQAVGVGRFDQRQTVNGVDYLNTSVLGGAQNVDAEDNILLQIRVDSPTGSYGIRIFARNADGDGGSHLRITNDTNGRWISFETNDPPDNSRAEDNDPAGPFSESDLPSVGITPAVDGLDASSDAFPFIALDSPVDHRLRRRIARLMLEDHGGVSLVPVQEL